MPRIEVTRPKPATSGRNPHCPRGDRLIYAYAFDEGSGTSLNNLGTRGDLHSTNWDASLVTDDSVVPSWQTDANEQAPGSALANIVRLTDAESNYVSIPVNNDEAFEQWTIMIRFKWLEGASLPEPLFNNGKATSNPNDGGLIAWVPGSGSGSFGIVMRDQTLGSNYQYYFNFDSDEDQVHTLIMTGGPRGFYAWMDGDAPDTYVIRSTTQDEVPAYMSDELVNTVMTCSGTEMWLGRNTGLKYADYDLYGFYMWDIQMPERLIMSLFHDPYLPIRTTTDIANFEENVTPMIRDITSTTATFTVNIKESPSKTTGLRITYSTNEFLHDGATVTSTSPLTGDGGDQLNLTVTGLTANTQYYGYAEYYNSTDDEYHIMPGGVFEFLTPATDEATLVFTSDSHTNVASALETDDSVIQGLDIVNNSTHPSHMAVWRHDLDIYQNAANIAGRGIDAVIALGDEWFPDSASDPNWEDNFRACYPRYRNRRALLFRVAQYYGIVGNHEQEANYLRHDDSDSGYNGQQKLGAIYRKKFIPSPTLHGEGSDAYDTTTEWLAGESPSNVDIQSNTTDNSSPLQNFWEKKIANATILGCDVYRYTGDPRASDPNHGDHDRPSAEFTFGSLQKTWIQDRLNRSTSTWKFIVMHNLPGGEYIAGTNSPNWYGWGSGRQLTSEDEIWLKNICRDYNVTAIIKGHDHRFTRVVNDTVNIITCPAAGAPSLMSNGWNSATMEASHGSAFTEGAGVDNVIKSFNAYGYLIVKCTATSCTVYVRNTWMSTGISAYSNNIDNGLTEHWLAPGLLTLPGGGIDEQSSSSNNSGTVTLSERPEVVFCALDAEDYVDGFWDNGLTNDDDNYHTPISPTDQPWDGQYRTSEITINSGTSGSVAVAHVPRTLYSFSLTNATSRTKTTGTLTAQDILGITDPRGNAGKPHVDTSLSSANRENVDFRANHEEWPAGDPFDERAISEDR